MIALRGVTKTYKTAAGGYQALKGIDLEIERGEFVGIIGRSGSGKSTLMNMITGIDRPSTGEVLVDGAAVHTLSENELARWRGRRLGIVFQFFQLLPGLSVIENVMMPMDFCHTYPLRQRRARGLELLELVGMAEQADKQPAAISGGQQQRVAIARSLANDPPLIVADEPTGNLDSKTADAMFKLFERLAAGGKTVVMVTHDSRLAQRVSRTVIIADGEVVNEWVAQALPALSPELMLAASRKLQPVAFPAGASIIRPGQPGEKFYILTEGRAEVTLKSQDGNEIVAAQIEPGQCFGEIALFNHSRTVAAVRARPDAPVCALAMNDEAFQGLLAESPDFHAAMQGLVQARLDHNRQAAAL